MNIEEQRRISELTARIVEEKDPEMYLALVNELDAIMAAKANRLRKAPETPSHSS